MSANAAFAQAESFAPEPPSPLMRVIPDGDAYPIEALGPLRAAAEAIFDKTQAPAAIGAQAVLGVASLAAQGLADIETLASPAPCSLYLLTIAQSGERKSACDRLAMPSVFEFQRELGDAYRDETTAHRIRVDIWERQRADILKSANTEPTAAEADLQALGPAPESPLHPVIVSSEPTFEGLAKNLAYARPALGIFSDEGGAFLGGHAMNSDNRLKTVAGLSGLWDGTPVNRTRAGDGVATFSGRRVASHLMVQPIAAAGLLADPIANGQGFLARFLITEPPTTIGTRTRRGHSIGSDAALTSFAGRVGDMLRADLPLREGTANELDPPTLALDPDARHALVEFHEEVERGQIAGGPYETTRPFASKAAEHAARIAGVMTLYGDTNACSVSVSAMSDAITLARFYLSEAQRLSDAAEISSETQDAEVLRKWLLSNWSEAFISATDAAQHGPSRLRETAKLKKLLRVLEQHGWLEPAEGGAEIRGKQRREAWRVVR